MSEVLDAIFDKCVAYLHRSVNQGQDHVSLNSICGCCGAIVYNKETQALYQPKGITICYEQNKDFPFVDERMKLPGTYKQVYMGRFKWKSESHVVPGLGIRYDVIIAEEFKPKND